MDRLLKSYLNCLFIGSVLVLVSSCQSASLLETQVPVNENKCMAEDYQCLETIALMGDINSARRLREVHSADGEEAEYWVKIAAENGDIVSQFNYGVLLLQKTGSERYRSIFWFRKAAAAGDKESRQLIEAFDSSDGKVLPLYPPVPSEVPPP